MSRHGLPTSLSVWGATLVDPVGRPVAAVDWNSARANQLAHELADAYNCVGEAREKVGELEFRLDYEETEHRTTQRLIKEFLASLNQPNDSAPRIAAYAALTEHLATL